MPLCTLQSGCGRATELLRSRSFEWIVLHFPAHDYLPLFVISHFIMHRPPPLAAGARVALISPAGPLRNESEVARAEDNVRSLGWISSVGDHARRNQGYFAGSDDERITDLNRAINDPNIDAIWCLRGGYGAMRLLDRVDYDALRKRPKPLIGFSDITALHCALQSKCDTISYHGPTARAKLDAFTLDSLRSALAHRESCGIASDARVIREGAATGRIIGGNLALLTALVGTPWMPTLRDALLLLEDINEATYRVDRMFQQLFHSGALEGCRGIVFGHCTSCAEEADGGGSRTLDEVLTEIADRLRIPCLAGIPVGHIDSQWTVPLGAFAEMDTSSKRLRTVEVS